MNDRSISVIATVECQSQSRGEERPVALVICGRRFEITEIHDRAMISNIDAGSPTRHRLWVETDDGRRFELTRIMPDGVWRVKTAPTE